MGIIRRHRDHHGSHDPFLTEFFSRIPAATARSFTDEQIDAIRMAFGARERGMHAVDIRFTLPVVRRYVVFLLGAERRRGRRRAGRLRNLIGNAGAFAVLMLSVSLPVLGLAWGVEWLFIAVARSGAGY